MWAKDSIPFYNVRQHSTVGLRRDVRRKACARAGMARRAAKRRRRKKCRPKKDKGQRSKKRKKAACVPQDLGVLWRQRRCACVQLLISAILLVSARLGDFTKLIARNQRRSPVQLLEINLVLSFINKSFIICEFGRYSISFSFCFCLVFVAILCAIRCDALSNVVKSISIPM